jgi:EsV-1-7 cysteine-rich motif
VLLIVLVSFRLVASALQLEATFEYVHDVSSCCCAHAYARDYTQEGLSAHLSATFDAFCCAFTTNNQRSRYCAVHKKDGMIVVLAGCCNADNCDKQPSFGFVGERPRFCATHKVSASSPPSQICLHQLQHEL